MPQMVFGINGISGENQVKKKREPSKSNLPSGQTDTTRTKQIDINFKAVYFNVQNGHKNLDLMKLYIRTR